MKFVIFILLLTYVVNVSTFDCGFVKISHPNARIVQKNPYISGKLRTDENYEKYIKDLKLLRSITADDDLTISYTATEKQSQNVYEEDGIPFCAGPGLSDDTLGFPGCGMVKIIRYMLGINGLGCPVEQLTGTRSTANIPTDVRHYGLRGDWKYTINLQSPKYNTIATFEFFMTCIS